MSARRSKPDGYAETPEGLLFLADGLSVPRRWDGIGSTTHPVGVTAPAGASSLAKTVGAADPGPTRPLTACTVLLDAAAVPAGDVATATPIAGTYYAYVRWMNAAGVFSTLSPISAALTLVAADGAFGLVYNSVPVPPPGITRRQILRNVTGNTNTFYVDVDTSDVVSTTFTTTKTDDELRRNTSLLASAAQNTPGIAGIYYALVRYVNDRGAVSDVSTISAALVLTATDYCYGVTYSAVPVPTQANVVRRQILRNTAGQTDVFYVDVDTEDLVATTFTSVKYDTALSAGEAVPLFDEDGLSLANSHGVPPTHKVALGHHLGRMFLSVDQNYSDGGCAVTSGSATVTGLNTQWTTAMAGRNLWVNGASAAYEILSVDEDSQTITLTAAYPDATAPFASYTVRPQPAERRLVYYSSAGEPESWPATQAISVQEDGDEITGLMVMGSFLYVLERRHVYRYTFQSDPATDGYVFLSGVRGCVNNRCWAQADGVAYLLDQAGVHAFDGESTPVSQAIQPIFRHGGSGPKVNWQASELFFALHSPHELTIRWFVALSGERRPRHALCYYYPEKRWWIEEFDRPVTAGCEGSLSSRRRVFLAAEAGRVYLAEQGSLDGVEHTAGKTRGQVTAADAYSLSDAEGGWPAGLAGASVTIATGKGAGQRRQIHAQTDTRLSLVTPWLVTPDETSVYQIGAIGWAWKSGWLRYAKEEADNPRRVEVLFETTDGPASFTARIFRDFSDEPVVWQNSRPDRDSEGFASEKGSPDLVARTDVPRGFAQQRMDGHKDANATGTRYVSVGLQGASGAEPQAFYQLVIDGAKA